MWLFLMCGWGGLRGMALNGCQQESDLVGELGDFLVGAVHAFVGLFIGASE